MRIALALMAAVLAGTLLPSLHATEAEESLKQQEYRSLLEEVGYEAPPGEPASPEPKKAAAKESVRDTKLAATESEIQRLAASNKALKEFLVDVQKRMDSENKETRAHLANVREENKKLNRELQSKLRTLADKEKAVEARQATLEKVVATQTKGVDKIEKKRAEETHAAHAEAIKAERAKLEQEYAQKVKDSETREKDFLANQEKDMKRKIELAVAELKQQLADAHQKRLAAEVSKIKENERKRCDTIIVPKALKKVEDQTLKIHKKREAEEHAQIADQKSKGMVTYGKFKSVRKEKECISRYRLHFWKCKSDNNGDCWKTLYKEFKNCLKVTVPLGKNYADEAQGILKKEKDHVK